MAFTEFCCRSGGSNMNGGGLASGAEPATTPVYSATNGGWNSGTGVFTPTSGDPSATVAVGDFANVFLDGATTPVFVARVTARNSTTITLSTSAKIGTAPTTAGTGISINVGGAWLGPNAAVGFPINLMWGALTNASTDTPRVNMKNDQTYNITAQITGPNQNEGYILQGYTSTFGDGGRATIKDNLSGTAFTLLVVQINWTYIVEDMIFDANGAATTGTAAEGAAAAYRPGIWRRCTFKNSRTKGLYVQYGTQAQATIVECEAYNNNLSNTVGAAGFANNGAPMTLIRCISHDNPGSNSRGFNITGAASLTNCIAANNGGIGFNVSSNASGATLTNCDAYNNGSHGYEFSNSISAYVENCTAFKNGGYAFNSFAADIRATKFVNCAVGTGTQANTSGTFSASLSSRFESGTLTFASDQTPWVDPANGDFRLTHSSVKNTGRGTFFQTTGVTGWSTGGTIAYPDIGAAQHQDAGGSSGPVGQLKQFNRGTPY